MYDVAFLHPPLSFRKIDYPLGGVFESNTGTTDMLTESPLGMIGLASRLRASGFRTKVVNLAKVFLRQRTDPEVDVWKVVQGIDAQVYGIGLHWSVHAPGAVELAARLKQLRPDRPLIVGGLTATFFHEELLRQHQDIDLVVLGECEHVIGDIVAGLLEPAGDVARLPNVAYRRAGQVQVTQVTVPDSFEGVDYVPRGDLVEPAPRPYDRDSLLCGYPLVRGCYRNCRFCGGSRFSYSQFFHRPRHASPGLDHFRQHLRSMVQAGARTLRLYGDSRAFGPGFDASLREALGELEEPLDAAIEVFALPTREYLAAWKAATGNLVLIISPESTFDDLRRVHGKTYSNRDLLQVAEWCEELGIQVVLSLMYAMPGHTRERILAELDFCDEYLRKHPHTALMFQPYLYLDPGCEIFVHPDRFGMSVHFRTLQDIIDGLSRPHWYYAVGYELDGMSKDELCQTILDVSERMAWLNYRHERLSALNVVKTYENVMFHRLIIDHIVEQAPSDPDLQRYIEDTLPGYQRRSNTSLVHRPFLGYVVQDEYDVEASVYEAFPLTLEVLVRFDLLELEPWVRRGRAFQREHLQGAPDLPSLLAPLQELYRRAVADRGVSMPFLEDLMRFEWLVYLRFYQHWKLPAEAEVLDTAYDFDSMTEVLASLRRRGDRLELDPSPTRYELTQEELISDRAGRRRRINVLARKAFRLEGAVKTVVRAQLGIDCDLEVEDLPTEPGC